MNLVIPPCDILRNFQIFALNHVNSHFQLLARLGTVLSSINPPVLRFSKANYPVPGSGSTVPSETKMT